MYIMFGGMAMTRDEVFEYFGSFYQMQLACGIKAANALWWRKAGYIPLTMQFRLQEFTEGKLKADDFDPRFKSLQSKG